MNRSIEIYHTRQQIADRTHSSIDAVNKWLASGQLRKTKAGGKSLISETDFQDFLRRSTEEDAAKRQAS